MGRRAIRGRTRRSSPRRRGPRRARRTPAPDPRLHRRRARARARREGGRPARHLRRDAASPRAERRVDRRRPALVVGGGRGRWDAERSVGGRGARRRADVVRDVPGARLHLTHVSTGAALEHVRAAKAAGLPVTCDVTPHHLALSDEWIAGARRWSWEAVGGDGTPSDPWADEALVAAP